MAQKQRGLFLRFARDDYDLLLLAANQKMSVIVKGAIRAYLTGEEFHIPVVPYQKMELDHKYITVWLDAVKDADIIEFVDSIPKGNRSQIYKLLIRHAMDVPDIRQLLTDPDDSKRPKDVPSLSQKPKHKIIPPKPPQEIVEPPKPSAKEIVIPPSSPADNTGYVAEDEDSIFDLI